MANNPQIPKERTDKTVPRQTPNDRSNIPGREKGDLDLGKGGRMDKDADFKDKL